MSAMPPLHVSTTAESFAEVYDLGQSAQETNTTLLEAQLEAAAKSANHLNIASKAVLLGGIALGSYIANNPNASDTLEFGLAVLFVACTTLAARVIDMAKLDRQYKITKLEQQLYADPLTYNQETYVEPKQLSGIRGALRALFTNSYYT